jgi:hypothetical protein
MVMVVLLCSWLPPLAHGHGHPLLFLIAFFLDIVVSSCVFDCAFLGCGHGHPLAFLVAFLLALLWLSCISGYTLLGYRYGHLFMFLVAVLLANHHGHGCPFVFMVAFS